jgi:hypothetical protein
MSKLKFSDILSEMKVSTINTKPVPKAKVFTKIKDVVIPLEDYNYMADILNLPTTKEGFKDLLVVVDLATHEFDVEALKNRKSETIVNAFKAMLKRPHLSNARNTLASFQTDGGSEFKGSFRAFLKKNKIFHNITVPGRHSQNSMVESLNRIIGRLLNLYMNKKEEELDEEYREWTDQLDFVRKKLNAYRKVNDLPDMYEDKNVVSVLGEQPKYKIGDVVVQALDRPENAIGELQPTEKFREGDYRWSRVPKKIVKVLYMDGKIKYRYLLEGIQQASYTEKQLKPSAEKETKFKVAKLVDHKPKKNPREYLVQWKGYRKKKDNTWETKQQLIDDGLSAIIDEYNKEFKVKIT